MGTQPRHQEFRDWCKVCKHLRCSIICGTCPVYSSIEGGCVCTKLPTLAELDFKQCKYFAPCNPKFKVGDKVRFVHNITPSIEHKNKWIGRVFEIDKVLPFGSAALKDRPYSIRETWVAHEGELELYEENKKEKEPMEKKIARSEKFARQCETCIHDGSAYECRKCKCEDCVCNTEDNGCRCNEWASPMELDAGMCAYYKKTEGKIRITMEEVHKAFLVDKDVKIYIANSVKECDKIYEDHRAETFRVDEWKPIKAPDNNTLAFQLLASGLNKAGKHVMRVFYPRVEITFNTKSFGTGSDKDEKVESYWTKQVRFSSDGRVFLKTLYPDYPLTVKADSGTFDGVEYKDVYYVTKETEPFRVIYTDDLKRKFGGDVEIVPVKLQRAKLDDFYEGDKVIFIGVTSNGPGKGDIGEVILNDHSDIIPIACRFPTQVLHQTIRGVDGWWCSPNDLVKICEDQTHFKPGDMVIYTGDEHDMYHPKKFTIGVVLGANGWTLHVDWPVGSTQAHPMTGRCDWFCSSEDVMKIRKVGQDK